jgi:hypothetical protein
MKKLFTLWVCSTLISAQAQTIIYSENFEGTNTFTLNSADQSSTGGGYNKWIINNAYNGGTFSDPCFGSPTPIATTPSQPLGITNAPNSFYMHIVNTDAELQGVINANFLASDGNILCVGDQNYFSKTTSAINTTGQTGVSFSFYWLCAGSSASYGELYYSTDGGTNWFLQLGNLQNQSSWVQATQTNAIWDNQANLKFGFRFVNGTSFSASDPPFCVDEIVVSVPAAATVTTGSASAGSPYCAGENFVLPYTITGTFTAGNVFTAQLSDGVGSFAAPINIGSVTTTSAGNINCGIPAAAPSGVGYLVRVVASTPAVTGSTTGPITINALPLPAPTNTGPYCAGSIIFLHAAAGAADYDWTGPNSYVQNNTQDPTITNAIVSMTGTYTVTATTSAGCSATGTTMVTVLDCSGIEDANINLVSLYPNPTQDIFTIGIPESMIGETKISIVNMVGQQVYVKAAVQATTTLSSSSLGLHAGIYLIQVTYKEQNKVLRLIVR